MERLLPAHGEPVLADAAAILDAALEPGLGAELARDGDVDRRAALLALDIDPLHCRVGASPVGPKSTVGMPAAAKRAESAQKGTPTSSGPPACSLTSRTISSSAETSNGSRKNVDSGTALELAEELGFGLDVQLGLAGKRAPLGPQEAVLGVSRELAATFDRRCVD